MIAPEVPNELTAPPPASLFVSVAPDNAEPVCRQVEKAVAAGFGVPLREMRRPGRGSVPASLARQTAIYLGHVVFGWSYTELGRVFRRDRTTVAHACRVIEERRDDPDVDAALHSLEILCARTASRCRRAPGGRV